MVYRETICNVVVCFIRPERSTIQTCVSRHSRLLSDLFKVDPDMDIAAVKTLAGVLRYDRKLNTYKLALLRALNDAALAFPDVVAEHQPVAVPLRYLAASWVAYYWPFCDPAAPIYQGPRIMRDGRLRHDIAFRPAIEQLRQAWEALVGPSRPSDGFFVRDELRSPRKRNMYAASPAGAKLLQAFDAATAQASQAAQYPIQYAGPGGSQWSVFPRPLLARAAQQQGATLLPGTSEHDRCVLVAPQLWQVFQALSLWVEALCIHEWALFLEGVDQGTGRGVDRGLAYQLLTDHPQNRLPLTWERNAVQLLVQEGAVFVCPWTGRPLRTPEAFDLDHLVPVAVYPLNELWNLVPADRAFNQHVKRDRLPSDERLAQARPRLAQTYGIYLTSKELAPALRSDATGRFAALSNVTKDSGFSIELAEAVAGFVAHIRDGRGAAVFS